MVEFRADIAERSQQMADLRADIMEKEIEQIKPEIPMIQE